MHYFAFCVLIACFSFTSINNLSANGNDSDRQGESETDVGAVVKSGNDFALDLYHCLRTDDGNLFFSPSSISVALAMTYAGAEGQTEQEMAKTLHFNDMAEAQLHQSMRELQSYWSTNDKKKGIQLNLANRLWGQENRNFLEPFLKVTREQYAAELARLNFADSEDARQIINQWVESQTNEKIKDLIPAGAIDASTELVLTNAVYFKGHWTSQFKKALTTEGDFHLSSSDKTEVPLMNQQGSFRYGQFDDLQVLEIPYGDGSASMVVLLPNNVDGLADLEAKLTLQNLQEWTTKLARKSVQVTLPKFKTTSEFQLNEVLQSLGMVTAFDASRADFSGMTASSKLYISAVVHKAFVDVNEEGTEAAAATGVIMSRSAVIPRKPQVFRADHPFIFMIRDNRNDAILFMGRVQNPAE